MDFPWNTGLVKQIKDIFVCEVLKCEPKKEDKNGKECSMGK